MGAAQAEWATLLFMALPEKLVEMYASVAA